MKQNYQLLNEYMANLKVLENNLYNMHFNVIGSSFFGLHRKLQEYYEMVGKFYDATAERIKMLGGYPETSLPKIEEMSTFKSMRSMDFTGQQVLEVLENDFGFITEYSKDLSLEYAKENDLYTSSMLNEQMMYFEKELWMIRSSLK